MIENFAGLVWLSVFVVTYGGIYVLIRRGERARREQALRDFAAIDAQEVMEGGE